MQRVLSKQRESRILFADLAEKVNRKRISQKRCLVISEGSLYTLTPPPAFKMTNRVPLDAIVAVAMSTYADGYFVLRVAPGIKDVPADLLLTSVRKAEILTTLVREASNSGRELKLEFSDRIEYRSKKGGGFFSSGLETRTVLFSEQASLGKQAAIAQLDDAKVAKTDLTTKIFVSPAMGSDAPIQLDTSTPRQAWVAKKDGGSGGSSGTGTGGPGTLKKGKSKGYGMAGGAAGYGDKAFGVPAASSTSKAPPLPPAPPGRRQTFSSFPRCQALHEFRESGADYLSFGAGAVLHVLEQQGGEWWTAELDGKVGLIPSNRVKMLM